MSVSLPSSDSYFEIHKLKKIEVIAFTFLYILVTAAGSELFNFTAGGGGALEFIKSKTTKSKFKGATVPASDVENGASEPASTSVRPSRTLSHAQEEEILREIEGAGSVFTWENVSYTVPYNGGERQLLNEVSGYAKPGCSKYFLFINLF